MTAQEREQAVKKSLSIRLGAYYYKHALQKSLRLSLVSRLSSVCQESDLELWQLIDQQTPIRTYNARISKHAIIDEEAPFILYAIQLRSNFSSSIVKKRFVDFTDLQQRLLTLSN